ncbi:PTS phosphocarrier protein NPr [Proteus myxofaciens]|uniref:Phosphocarrier protein NPr n=1 Tax=Proteus myxofaciens ATCC 19692 TaxID=1354337 RepID=A0A198FMV3_9GAMM|nr:PTS phosphocarrier protein NPr [Proteus myxofaciens]OAT26105.1 nitrogen regulation-associated phosphocarrier protein [Proteus myxofaciens ATCC 19692]
MTQYRQVAIKNRLGMHARPAMKLFDLVKTFQSTVILRNHEGVQAQADSVIAMLMLDSEQGSYIDIEATGSDEIDAINAIISLFESGFDED